MCLLLRCDGLVIVLSNACRVIFFLALADKNFPTNLSLSTTSLPIFSRQLFVLKRDTQARIIGSAIKFIVTFYIPAR